MHILQSSQLVVVLPQILGLWRFYTLALGGRMRESCVVAGLVLAACFHQVTMAQSNKPGVYILVERVDNDPDAAKCGISERSIQGAASSAARYNRIRTGGSSEPLTLYVNANPISDGSRCGLALRVEIQAYGQRDVRDIGQTWGKIVLCQSASVGFGGGPMQPGHLNAEVKSHIDTCIANLPKNVLQAIST